MQSKSKLPVRVETFKIEPLRGEVFYVLESTKTIDHNSPADRKWLGVHSFWAMRNNRKVSTFPVS